MVRINLMVGKYIGRALTLFFEIGSKFVVLKAADRVIERAIWTAEVLKRKVGGLHQVTRFTENKIVDVYEPKEEGLERVEQERFLTVIEILLTKEPSPADKAEAGYQSRYQSYLAPLQIDEKELLTKEKWEAEKVKRQERRDNPDRERRPRRENSGDDDHGHRDTRRRGDQENRGTREGGNREHRDHRDHEGDREQRDVRKTAPREENREAQGERKRGRN